MITSAPDLAASAEKTGFLTKQGKVRKNWKKRWFILKDSNLHYFATPTAAKPINSIKLTSDCTTGTVADPKFPTLSLTTAERVWQFRANDDAERDGWLSALNDALGKVGGSGSASTAASPASGGASDAAASTGSSDATSTPAGAGASSAASAGSGDGQLIPVGGKTEHGSEIVFHGRILYDFEPRHEDELSLKFGDLVAVYLTRDDGWWRAVTVDGRDGLFPSNYAERI